MLSIGLSRDSARNIRRFDTELSGLEHELRALTPAAVAELAQAVAEAMKDTFKPHDRTGKENDPSQWKTGYVHTVQTLHVDLMGMRAVISMGGGAPYVEFGTDPHVIHVKDDAQWLTFKGEPRDDSPEGWTKVKEIHHPGSKAHDFVGEAVARVGAAEELSHVLEQTRIIKFVSDHGYAGPASQVI